PDLSFRAYCDNRDLPAFPTRRSSDLLLDLELRGLGGAPATSLEQPHRGVEDGGVVHAVLLRRVRRAAVNRHQLGQGLPFARGKQIGRAHVCTPVTSLPRMPSSA